MLNTIIPSLVVLSVSGITFIAYKHPNAYQKMFKYLMIIASIVYLGFILWSVAVRYTEIAVLEIVPLDSQNAIKSAVSALKFRYLNVSIIFFCSSLYLLILTFLSFIRIPEDKEHYK